MLVGTAVLAAWAAAAALLASCASRYTFDPPVNYDGVLYHGVGSDDGLGKIELSCPVGSPTISYRLRLDPPGAQAPGDPYLLPVATSYQNSGAQVAGAYGSWAQLDLGNIDFEEIEYLAVGDSYWDIVVLRLFYRLTKAACLGDIKVGQSR